MKKVLVLGLVVIAVLVIAFFATSSPEEKQETEDSDSIMVDDSMMADDVEESMESDDKAEDVDLSEYSGDFTLVQSESTLAWTAERIVGKHHEGEVEIQDGALKIENGELVSGAFTIDMTTISESNDNQMLLTHLSSEDFFKTEEFPTSKLVLTSFEKTDEGYLVTGDLTIMDKTNEISFPAEINFGDDSIKAHAEFDIDRTKWGIKYDSGSFVLDIGDKAIRDEIKYTLDLSMQKEIVDDEE